MARRKNWTPKSFEIGGHIIKVVKKKSLDKNKEALGEAHFFKNIIYVQKACGNYHQSQQDVTFYHEKVHILLFNIGRQDLAMNEKFVEALAQALYQSDVTSKF